MAENHYQADADNEREVPVVTDPQLVGEGAVAEERADLEALPTNARLVRSFESRVSFKTEVSQQRSGSIGYPIQINNNNPIQSCPLLQSNS